MTLSRDITVLRILYAHRQEGSTLKARTSDVISRTTIDE